MHRYFLFLVVLLNSQTFSQEKPDASQNELPFGSSPVLEGDFKDKFESDTRKNYKIEGDVQWENGKLAFDSGSTLVRKLKNSGPWIELEINLEFPKLSEDGQTSELKFWLDFDENQTSDTCVWFRQKREKGKTKSAIFVADAVGTWDSKSNLKPVGAPKVFQSPLNKGKWKIVFRNSAWRIYYESKFILGAQTNKELAGPEKIAIVCDQAQHFMTEISSSQTREAGYFFPDLRRALYLRAKVLRHEQNSNHLETIEAAKEFEAMLLKYHGRFDLNYVWSIQTSARAHQSLNQFSEAEKKLIEAKEITAKVAGVTNPLYANKLNYLANLYNEQGRYKQSEDLYLEAKGIYEKFQNRDRLYATLMSNLAIHYETTGQYQKAIDSCMEAKSVYEEKIGKENKYYATTLNILGAIYLTKGDHQKAKECLLIAKDIRKRVVGEKHPAFATSLNNLSSLYRATGQFEKAIAYSEMAREIRETTVGKKHPDYASSLSNLGDIYRVLGALKKAESLHRKAMEIRQSIYGKNHSQFASSAQSLATVYQLMGEYDKAEPLLLSAVNIFEKTLGKEHTDYGSALNSLAALYESLGEYDKALKLFQETLKIRERAFGKNHPSYGVILNNLANTLHSVRDFKNAEKLYLEAKKVWRDTGPENGRYLASTLNNLSMLYFDMGRLEEAESYAIEAIEKSKIAYGREHPNVANSIKALADLYLSKTKLEKAEALYEKAKRIQISSLGKGHPDVSTTLNGIARCCFAKSEFAKAESLLFESIRIDEANTDRYSAIQTPLQQLNYRNRFRSRFDAYLSVAQKVKLDIAKPFEAVLNFKGRVQLRQARFRNIATDAKARDLFAKYRSVSQQLFKHLSMDSNVPSWKDRLATLIANKESIEKELANMNSDFAETKQRISLKQIQDALPVGVAFINFHVYMHSDFVDNEWEYEVRLLAFVVRKNHVVEMIQLGSAVPFGNAIRDFRTQFTDKVVGPKKLASAKKILREKLWLPVREKIGNSKTIFISPDGLLGALPFAAIPSGSPEGYLIDDYNILTVTVPQLLPQFKANRKSAARPEHDLLLIGDIEYDKTSTTEKPKKKRRRRGTDEILRATNSSWGKLNATSGEIASIQKLFFDNFQAEQSAVRTLEKSNATEANFRSNSAKYELIHIATHGFFAPPEIKSHDSVQIENKKQQFRFGFQQFPNAAVFKDTYYPGLLSGLVFAGANVATTDPSLDDGIMTAEEIAGLQLSGVGLVTLSACETGLGKTAGGEGLIGLQRSFQIAGARSVVSSLWKVNDVATRQLMERFYKNMFERDMNKLEAMMEAQRFLLNNPSAVRGKTIDVRKIEDKSKSKRLEPRYWAAWVLSGDWE